MKDGYGGMDLHLGAGTRFYCHTYPENPEAGPILVIEAAGVSLMLSNRTRGAVEAGDVENARRLLEVVSEFTAEVERLHAINGAAVDSMQDAAA
ncbi:hypothetical protein ACFOY4_33345 [Actinomadura syzygii]|uniref:Uncharacterized protein n=1 Tax=Actinomadura syzygii TaxID=1427538 RepID=A0A5D0U911_9ACTN|nr:hypothetical protein [Actinomadura syzygii]TYC15051.1 hypothetical protein FXF65_13055 [Actinomadura syzygii]